VLHERDDFVDLLVTVGEATGAGAAIVEKDYWVTEALRLIAARFGAGVVFKGGTSLSKAWDLIQRFSEDIDLLVRSEGDGLETRGARDRYMKAIEETVGGLDGLEQISEGTQSTRGIHRTVVFAYGARASAREGLSATIILEMGIRGGAYPTAVRQLQSMLGAALAESGIDDESIQPFDMTVLHPRRTLVEKLFAIHCACELWLEGRTGAIDRQTRHLSDIYALLGDEDVAAFVGSAEYHELIPEIDEFGRTYFSRDHRTPDRFRFGGSRSLAPGEALRAAIEAEYARSRFLFFGEFPELRAIFDRIEAFRDRL
jgi:Domain of unknown function (DUF1814).